MPMLMPDLRSTPGPSPLLSSWLVNPATADPPPTASQRPLVVDLHLINTDAIHLLFSPCLSVSVSRYQDHL